MSASILDQQWADALAQIARLTSELGRVASRGAIGLPSSINVLVLDNFEGAMDADFVVNFINALNQYFVLIGLTIKAQRARLA